MNKSAKKYSEYFIVKKRNETNESFFSLSQDAPKELTKLVYDIHQDFDCLPNDWIYSIIVEAFEELEETPLDNCSYEADCYYNSLYKWFGEPYANELCSEYLTEFGCGIDTISMYTIIGNAQYLAKDRIYRFVDEFLEEHDKENA